MNDIDIYLLLLFLVILLIISAFFSSSETGMIAVNRYRLKNLKNSGNQAAIRVDKLLEKTDELLSTILLGNNFVNILASAIATVIGIRLFGDSGIAIATGLLTFVVLIFAEILPKTIAAANPLKMALLVSWVLKLVTYLLKPFVWWLNLFTKTILKLFKVRRDLNNNQLNTEEIRTVLVDSKSMISNSHYKMLLGIIDLDKLTVEDIMISRRNIIGVNINNPVDKIINIISNSKHTRIPVYKDDISNCIGILHIKDILNLIQSKTVNKEQIIKHIREPLFILENSFLDEQLKILQQLKKRIALIVNEYGELQGLITLEDILEEIVGNFTTNINTTSDEIFYQNDGSYLVNGTILIRELNQKLTINLPIKSNAKTLNGLILSTLENIPEKGTSMKITNVMLEIISTKNTIVNQVKLRLLS